MDEDRRGAFRKNAFTFGSLQLAEGEMECLVWDATDGGAQIEVEAPEAIPATFTLRIAQGAAPRAATVAWRRNRRIGVTFPG